MAQRVKNLPAIRETQVQSLDWEDLLEKGMAIHSSIFAWRIPWTERPGGLWSWGRKELDITKQLIVDLQYGFPKKTREKLVINYNLRIFPFIFLL